MGVLPATSAWHIREPFHSHVRCADMHIMAGYRCLTYRHCIDLYKALEAGVCGMDTAGCIFNKRTSIYPTLFHTPSERFKTKKGG